MFLILNKRTLLYQFLYVEQHLFVSFGPRISKYSLYRLLHGRPEVLQSSEQNYFLFLAHP